MSDKRFQRLSVFPRFLTGLLNGLMAAPKSLVSGFCGKEHETVGVSVVASGAVDSRDIIYVERRFIDFSVARRKQSDYVDASNRAHEEC